MSSEAIPAVDGMEFGSGKLRCPCGQIVYLYWNGGELDRIKCACGRGLETEHASVVLRITEPALADSDTEPQRSCPPIQSPKFECHRHLLFFDEPEGEPLRIHLPDCVKVYVAGETYYAWCRNHSEAWGFGGLVGTSRTSMTHIADILRAQLSSGDPHWATPEEAREARARAAEHR